MYIPHVFREERIGHLHALIEAHPLALLVTHGASGLQATPVPFLLYPNEGKLGVLRAHLARANAHWKDLDSDHECLVIFQGEEGYITPSWYPSKAETQRAVPTWNYIVVEARGGLTVIDDAVWLRSHLNDLTRQHERIRLEPWSVEETPDDYLTSQLKAIVGIQISIESLSGKWKMSQNKAEADRLGVANGLKNVNDPHGNPNLANLLEAG